MRRGRSTKLADSELHRARRSEGELGYLKRPLSRGFERPYGWAWLLQLHLEASRHCGGLGSGAGAACASLRGPAERPSSGADLSDPRRHAFQHAHSRWSSRSNGRSSLTSDLAAAICERAQALVRERPRLPGVGARWGRVPVAGLDRGLVHGTGSTGAGVRGMVRWIPAEARSRPAGDALQPGRRQRPERRQDRPSGRTEPEPRLVLDGALRHCYRPKRPNSLTTRRRRISKRRCRMSRAIIWASIGWRRFALLALLANDT